MEKTFPPTSLGKARRPREARPFHARKRTAKQARSCPPVKRADIRPAPYEEAEPPSRSKDVHPPRAHGYNRRRGCKTPTQYPVHRDPTTEKLRRRPSTHPPNDQEGRQTPAHPVKGDGRRARTRTDAYPRSARHRAIHPCAHGSSHREDRNTSAQPTSTDRSDEKTKREEPALPRSRRISTGSNRPELRQAPARLAEAAGRTTENARRGPPTQLTEIDPMKVEERDVPQRVGNRPPLPLLELDRRSEDAPLTARRRNRADE